MSNAQSTKDWAFSCAIGQDLALAAAGSGLEKEVMLSSQYVVFVRPVTVDSDRSPRIGEGASDALESKRSHAGGPVGRRRGGPLGRCFSPVQLVPVADTAPAPADGHSSTARGAARGARASLTRVPASARQNRAGCARDRPDAHTFR